MGVKKYCYYQNSLAYYKNFSLVSLHNEDMGHYSQLCSVSKFLSGKALNS